MWGSLQAETSENATAKIAKLKEESANALLQALCLFKRALRFADHKTYRAGHIIRFGGEHGGTAVHAQTSWDGSTNNSWGTTANWSVAVPNSTTEAQFYYVGAINLGISIAATNRSAAGLVFNANADSPVTISTSGSAQITLGSSGVASYITVDVGAAAAHVVSTEFSFSGLGTTWTIDNASGFTASGIVDIDSNTRSFTKAGTGTATLSGSTVNLRGPVTVSAGSLLLTGTPGDSYFKPTSGNSNMTLSGGKIDMRGGNGEVNGSITGFGEFTNGGGTTRTLTLSRGSSYTLDALLSGNLALTKASGTSSAVYTVTNSNTYTGGTSILSGRILANNSLGSSALGTGAVSVDGGTLGGTGQIGTSGSPVAITIGAGGGRIEPGSSTVPAMLTDFGSIDLTSAGTTDMKFKLNGLTAGSGYDQIEQTGSLNLSAGTASLVLTMNIVSDPALGTIFNIINRPGNQSGVTGNFAGLPNGTVFTLTNSSTSTVLPMRIFYNYNSGDGFSNDVVLVVPEPSSLALFAFGTFMLYFFPRKRMRDRRGT